MSLDPELSSYLNSSIPFAMHVGIEVLDVRSGVGMARVPLVPTNTNHVGTLHAGALYSVAESASGAALLGTFREKLAGKLAVVKSASIDYRKAAKGQIAALGLVAGEPDLILDELETQGRVQFDVEVSLRDDADVEVATATFHWIVKSATPRGTS